jgi:hypothetical protein
MYTESDSKFGFSAMQNRKIVAGNRALCIISTGFVQDYPVLR